MSAAQEATSERRTASTQVFVDPAVLDADADSDADLALAVDADDEHHLVRVLRLRTGESVSVSDGAGRWRLATAVVEGGSLRLEPTGPVVSSPRSTPPLTVATAIPKGDRVDWLVRTAVEVGVDTIRFLHAERSAVRWKTDRATKQVERLQRIAREAARQSRRVWVPEVVGPVDALDVLPTCVAAEPGGRSVAEGDTFVAIGPEGGWSPGELERAADLVDLGPNVLRIETAALVAVTLCVTASH